MLNDWACAGSIAPASATTHATRKHPKARVSDFAAAMPKLEGDREEPPDMNGVSLIKWETESSLRRIPAHEGFYTMLANLARLLPRTTRRDNQRSALAK